MEISSDIDSVINFLKKKKEEGYKSVELIDDARDYGWFYINPTLKFIYNKREPGVLGIDIRTKRLWNLTFIGGDILKKVRYAIEKVIEVPETEGEKSIDNIINKKCKEENGLSYIYVREDDMKENGWNSLFDEV